MSEHKHKKSQTDKKADDRVKQLEGHLAEMEDKYKRALADYQNLMKQTQKERQEYIRFANQALINQLLPLLDNLELAAKHVDDPGLAMVVKQFHAALADTGTEIIMPEVGDRFDHDAHECVETIEGNEHQQDTIAQVSQVGYKWVDGGVIRHAKVVVYQQAGPAAD